MYNEERKYGTERCQKLLTLLGSPDKKLKIAHVAGTNGKGSTATFISYALKCAGKKVGTFTSPFIFSLEEEFCIDCKSMPSQKLEGYLAEVKKIAEGMQDSPSPFEIHTAVALYAFYKEGCEYAVIECGLGGRDDATNAVAQKSVAVITSVSLEHTAELGDTVTKICKAKSGIVKDCPVVVSALQSEEGIEFFKTLNPIFAGQNLTGASHFPDGESFIYKGQNYKIALNGSAQRYNAVTAIEALNILGVGDKYIKQGLAEAELFGRVQCIKKGERTYILDGSHNPQSFTPLIDGIKTLSRKPDLVFGCLADKDVEEIAKTLSPYFDRAFVFSPDNARAMDGVQIFNAFKDKIKNTTKLSTISQALNLADNNYVVVCGSFTILKEASEWIEKR
ncbi:MAG: bifunctional folylpolyglutamate synthase/dihydrofolate synthase [Candidatus Coproplasma sp.]